MDAPTLFPNSLAPIYEALRARLLSSEPGVIEEFKRTQVSFGLSRKFAWLTPLSKRRTLLTLDMWDEHDDPILRDVIRYRADKFTHQVAVDTPSLIDRIGELGWFEESAAWGRRERPGGSGP